jgi:hypothetical protein
MISAVSFMLNIDASTFGKGEKMKSDQLCLSFYSSTWKLSLALITNHFIQQIRLLRLEAFHIQ